MALKQKNLKEVVDTLSPLLFIKFFDISIFLGHRKVPLRSFLVFCDNKLFTRIRDTTLLGIKYFANWHFLKHRRFPLLNIRALSEKTSLKENPDFLKQKFFPIPEFSDRLRASTTKILALRQKKLTEIHDTPSPSIHENFRYRIFLGHRRVPDTMFFGIVRQQTFDKKSWYFPHWHKIFRNPNCSETQKGYSMKKFGTVRQNDFDRVSWFPTPLLSKNFFDTRNSLRQRRVPLRNILAPSDKTISTENPDLTLSSKIFFPYLNILTD